MMEEKGKFAGETKEVSEKEDSVELKKKKRFASHGCLTTFDHDELWLF